MIEELSIENLGVIAAARLPLGTGFTVITGETGAGKTMVLTGLDLLLGGRGDPGMVRQEAEHAVIEGSFVVAEDVAARVTEAGGSLDDDALILARRLPASGRSRSFAGGRSVPQAFLAELAENLVTVHGQSDQLRLRSPARQRELLDTYADAGPLLARYRATWQQLTELRAALTDWQTRSDERAGEAARLRAGLELLEGLDPQAGEDHALRVEAERLGNVEELREAAELAHGALAGAEGGGAEADVTALIGQARRALEIGDPELVALEERLAEVAYLVSDIATELATFRTSLEADPGRLQSVHERRAALRDAALRIGVPSPDELPEWSRQAAARLAEIDGPQDGGAALEEQIDQTVAELTALAAELTAARRDAGRRLADAVDEELAGLAMPGAHLQVRLEPVPEPGPWGAETVALLLQPRPDAPARPLGEGASGGELSRVMLALEVAVAAPAGDHPPTFVFDEIDAGVGGKAALEVGRRLARLARAAQVVVVTHLPQVAAFADTHLLVAKSTGATTITDVRHISGPEREQELARMLSGQEDSAVARRHAAELLERADVGR